MLSLTALLFAMVGWLRLLGDCFGGLSKNQTAQASSSRRLAQAVSQPRRPRRSACCSVVDSEFIAAPSADPPFDVFAGGGTG